MKKYLLILAFVFISCVSYADTTNNIIPDNTDKTIHDIAIVINDIWPSISYEHIITGAMTAFLVARTLRKYSNTGKSGIIGNLLSHVALDLTQPPIKSEEVKSTQKDTNKSQENQN